MSAQHTQGRLHVAGQDKVQIRSDKHQIAKAWSFAGKTGQENARRLAACWNACEGLHTESLERNKPLGDQLVDALNQRYELLAALKTMNRAYVNLLQNGRDRITMLGGECDPVDVMEANDPNLRESRAAVAKATGAQP